MSSRSNDNPKHSALRRLYWDMRRGKWAAETSSKLILYVDWIRAILHRKLSPVDLPANVGEQAYGHVRNVVALGERYPNSPGWKRQLQYIGENLRSMDLEPVTDRWHDAKEGLEFQNISVTIPGKSYRRIIIGAHHDTKIFSGHVDAAHNFKFDGANDGGSGVGLLLALAEVLRTTRNPLTIEFVFFDGEESLTVEWNGAERALFGSRRYVNSKIEESGVEWTDTVCAVIILDMVGCKDLHIDDDVNSDTYLKTIFRRAAIDLGYSKYFFRQREPIEDDHTPFINVGIPAIDLIQKKLNPYWHTPQDTLENVCEKSLQVVAEVVLTALAEIATGDLKVRPNTDV